MTKLKINLLSNYALKMYVQSQPPPKQLIAFDIGTRHTGCAISCMNLKKSYYLKSFKIKTRPSNDDSESYYEKLETELVKIINQNNPTAIIFGIPQKNSQTQYYQHSKIAMRTIIEGFIQKFKFVKNQENDKIQNQQKTFINCTSVDEGWTTKEAYWKLKDIQQAYAHWGHLHKQKQLLDGMAAMKILERYLTYYNS